MNNFLKLFFAFTASAIITFVLCHFIWPLIKTEPKTKDDPIEIITEKKSEATSNTLREAATGVPGVQLTEADPSETASSTEDISKTEAEVEITESVTYSEPVVNVSNVRVKAVVKQTEYYYSVTKLTASADGQIEYALEDNEGHSYTSSNGIFNKVAANNTGEYTVKVHDVDHNLVSAPKSIRGFSRLKPISNKLTAAELNSLFATGDYDGNRSSLQGRMAEEVTIINTSGNLNCPTYYEIFTAINLEGWTVSVESLGYDCLNRVSKIVINASK